MLAHDNMGESWKYTAWKKPVTEGDKLHDYSFIKYPEKVNPHKEKK